MPTDTLLDVPVLSYAPIVIPVPGRPVDLHVRATFPATGTDLPIILLSHGHGRSNNLSSLNGYAPLANLWAALGFAVLQPTHLSSATLRDRLADEPDAPYFWRSRAADMSRLIDALDQVEHAVPALASRLDRGRIAVAGHSLGGFTASLLLGAQVTEAGATPDLRDPRIGNGVLFGTPGRGDVLNGPMADQVPYFRTIDFSTMITPALIVAGDRDDSRHFTDLGPDWHADPYRLAPGPKSLLTVFGAEHIFGGISGYDATETTDENPAMVAALTRLTAAYLRSGFDAADDAWAKARAELADVGSVEEK
ncbi:alpha/beta hydrolase family protein [Microlunatus parietis]|uniref:Putative dienelactone hydrolase n=1 Tax=Microlunatus parietis TaxID=682979 RepID=A0A7Y9L9M3_9ACTN|nr:alpha/beta fold hydrolase [Microlunatus parietis]NYE68715.1 putative dienelactone hydrolase [Microlunatus parietis]